MLEDFFDSRRAEIVGRVWEQPSDTFMKEADDLAERTASGWGIGQPQVFADRRRIAVSHDKDVIAASFMVPFDGPEGVMNDVVSRNPEIPRCQVVYYDEYVHDDYTPAAPAGNCLLLKVSSDHPVDPRQFDMQFDEWHYILSSHLERANAEITEFNRSLPDIVRDAVADRKQKILDAEGVRAVLIGRHSDGGGF